MIIMKTISALTEKLGSAARAERIAFIDFKLKYEGQIVRSDIADEFGISETIASKDIAEYKSLTSESNIVLNKGSRTNSINIDSFESLIELDAKVALEMLFEGFCRKKVREGASNLYMRGCNDTVELSSENVSLITRAIHQKVRVVCEYYSGNSGDESSRLLEPTSVYFDGLNWVFRAYDIKSDGGKTMFKSFHFSRLKSVEDKGESASVTVADDPEWNTILPIHLVLHPTLKDRDKVALRKDFDIPDDSDELILTEKVALAWSLLDRWRVDTNIEPLKYPCFNFHLKNAAMLSHLPSVKFKITNWPVFDPFEQS